jgi:hypothetical protein
MYKNTAFVASTLPVLLLKNKIREWEIGEIIISGENIKDTYEYILKDYPNIKLKIVPKGKLANFAYLFIRLFLIHLKKGKVFFFHECCWFNFDFLIDYFRIDGYFYPHVTLNSFVKNSPPLLINSLQNFLLKILKKPGDFTQYKVPGDNLDGYYFVLAKNSYNRNIKKYSIQESYLLRKPSEVLFEKRNNDVLILLGRETVSDKLLINIYEEIIDELIKIGFNVYIKNHPRKDARLMIKKINKLNEIPAFIPFELIDKNFHFLIGCASTSLINHGGKAYSIINFSGMEEFEINKRINHLFSLPNYESITFPKTKEVLIDLLKESR